jgi:hypothetical protein
LSFSPCRLCRAARSRQTEIKYSEAILTANIDVWIQIENHAWDVSPNIDRMTGQNYSADEGRAPQSVTLTSPVTGAVRNNVTMYRPLSADALILRRYAQNWTATDDRKVNPWDLNERSPVIRGRSRVPYFH